MIFLTLPTPSQKQTLFAKNPGRNWNPSSGKGNFSKTNSPLSIDSKLKTSLRIYSNLVTCLKHDVFTTRTSVKGSGWIFGSLDLFLLESPTHATPDWQTAAVGVRWQAAAPAPLRLSKIRSDPSPLPPLPPTTTVTRSPSCRQCEKTKRSCCK